MDFSIQPPSTIAYFIFHKIVLAKRCLSFEDLSAYKMLWPRVKWYTLCFHRSSLNVFYFGIVLSTGLKLWCRGHLQCHELLKKFYKNPAIGRKFIRRDKVQKYNERQSGDIISLIFPF
jgi:hypothetical protein